MRISGPIFRIFSTRGSLSVTSVVRKSEIAYLDSYWSILCYVKSILISKKISVKWYIGVGDCSSLGQENFRHFYTPVHCCITSLNDDVMYLMYLSNFNVESLPSAPLLKLNVSLFVSLYVLIATSKSLHIWSSLNCLIDVPYSLKQERVASKLWKVTLKAGNPDKWSDHRIIDKLNP